MIVDLIGLAEFELMLLRLHERERRLEMARQLREAARPRSAGWSRLRGVVGTALIAWGEALKGGVSVAPPA